MTTQPLISVCIANYNGMEIVGECIDSVLNQAGDVQFEILVHDDASTDESVAYIKSRYPQVKLVTSTTNVGYCVSNNRMAAVAQGTYLLMLNNDAVLYPDALTALSDAAVANGRQCILTLPQYDHESGQLMDRGCLLDPFYNPVPNLDPNRQDVAMVIGACLWIDRILWDALGGFPEWFGSIAEDMYLCCRARLAGYAVRVLDHSGYRHWQGASFGGNKINFGRLQTTYRRRALSERNKTSVMLLVTPAPLLIVLFPLHLMTLCCEGILTALVKRDSMIWRSIYRPLIPGLWRDRRKIIGMRYEIQRCKDVSLRVWWRGFRLAPQKILILLRYGFPNIR